jgi:predicted GTPase
MNQVNKVIIPAIGLSLGKSSISEQCARRWLHKLGYNMAEVKKGVYVDGHERPDVVQYRKKFLDQIRAKDQ